MIHPSPSNLDLPLAAGLFSVFLCVIFGANAVAIKVAFTGLGVFTTAAIRFGLAAAAIFLWARWTRRSILLKKGQALQLLIFSTLFTVQLSCFYLGLSKSNASRGTLLVNLLPFFILFLAHFFIPGDRISKRKLFGILLGFSGLACMFLDKSALHSFVFIMPIAGVLMGGLILGEPITPKILLALAFIVSGIITVHWNPRTEAPAYPIRRSL
ncbi:MAG: DMT family transporter [Desulfohalobiaceae bacterium]|nr:DMT family transporter [Desulfohalobiaceae bacterium]